MQDDVDVRMCEQKVEEKMAQTKQITEEEEEEEEDFGRQRSVSMVRVQSSCFPLSQLVCQQEALGSSWIRPSV